MKAEEIKDKKIISKAISLHDYTIFSRFNKYHKNNRNESNEWKIQLNMGVNFISSNDTGEIRTFLCGVIMKKLDRVMKQMRLLMGFLNLF